MRMQIAAANWKMNCTLDEAKQLLKELSSPAIKIKSQHRVIIAVPFPYLILAKEFFTGVPGYFVAAQNCYDKEAGAYTGEVSAAMIASCGITHVIIGHSERRSYFSETNAMLAEKVKLALKNHLTPIFCCGESLKVREENLQNAFIGRQIEESLFHLEPGQFPRIIIAYEPIWAIGTGKTATSEQAQEMHSFIRRTITEKYGSSVAEDITILYGGSVKGSNAAELFEKPDVDGGLVGGASLKAAEFKKIIESLKK